MKENKTKEFYSLSEVKYLEKYYYKKIVGQIVEFETKLKITDFAIYDYGKGFYDLKCIGKFLTSQCFTPYLSIKSVSEMMKIELPKEVLKGLNQS